MEPTIKRYYLRAGWIEGDENYLNLYRDTGMKFLGTKEQKPPFQTKFAEEEIDMLHEGNMTKVEVS